MKLPPPKKKGTFSLEETLERRRSKRAYLSKRLSPEQISQLLWAAQGIFMRGKRTVPSAGGIYPLEIYLVDRDGVHHYVPQNHELVETVHGNVLPQLVSGSVIVSLVMSLPTIGPILLRALQAQDMFLASTITLMLGVLTVIGTLISDLLLALLDPRIRLPG